jgi:hypothetical protein
MNFGNELPVVLLALALGCGGRVASTGSEATGASSGGRDGTSSGSGSSSLDQGHEAPVRDPVEEAVLLDRTNGNDP